MNVLPTAYLAPLSYFRLLQQPDTQIEVMESFEKQTFRNRCLISDTRGQEFRLTVPVRKSEHKQLTRDIEISYQTRWQHQHWMALVSSYEHTPYFLYYADYFRPWYEREVKWLVDLNDGLTAVILDLLQNRPPSGTLHLPHTADWSTETWTDQHPWQREKSILEQLFEHGPMTND